MSETSVNTQLQVFANPEFGEIRSILIDGTPWLVGKDVAKALGYGNGKSLVNAVAKHVDDEDKGVTELMTPGGKQKITIINESGLYSLILSSKLPSAKKFKRWVTSEVLPSIRRTGSYQMPGSDTTDPAFEKLLKISREIRLAPKDRLPLVIELFETNGYDVPALQSVSAISSHNAPQDIVQAFADEILPQSQWDLLPFGVLYDLYSTWCDRNQIADKPLGKNTFIRVIAGLADAGKISGWRCPGKKHPVRPKQLMAAPEPVIAYALNPRHLVRRQTYTGLIRM